MQSDFDIIFRDGADLFTSPGDFTSRDWINVLAIAGATVAVSFADEPMRGAVQDIRTDRLDDIFKFGDYYGGPFGGLSIGSVTYIAGLAADDNHTRETGRMVVQAVAYSAAVNQVIKVIVGRARPDQNRGARSIEFFEFDNNFNSHPSGHSTVAMAISTVLSQRIDNPYASVGLYALAATTIFQRMLEDRHWLSDTFLGGTLGILIGSWIVRHDAARNLDGTYDQTLLLPGSSPHTPILQYNVGL